MKWLTRVGVVVVTALVTVLAVPSAHAEEYYLFGPEWAPTWGCEVTYSLTDRMRSEYGTYLQDSLPRITAYTGIEFSEVTSGGDITYAVDPNITETAEQWDALGLASTDGTVLLAPVNEVTGYFGSADAEVARINLITHETLHVLGLDHAPDGSSEIMAPLLDIHSTAFGDTDLAGMEFIREWNGCSTAGIPVPPDKTRDPFPISGTAVAAGGLAVAIFAGAGAVVAVVAARNNRRRRTPPGSSGPLPAAGWYLDPWSPSYLRWWDGQAWTVHTWGPFR